VDEAQCRERLLTVAKSAAAADRRVEVDMESSSYTERTLSLVADVQGECGNLRAVIQAYLRRSEDDIRRLNRMRIPVRLCKGAYLEGPEVAFPTKREVDENYRKLMRLLLEDGFHPAIATHDETMISEAVAIVRERGMTAEDFEFQMLFGIRRELQQRLVGQGYHLRVYIPYGDAWYPYFMRRLAERPANVWFALRNMLRN
jgi:proline dehydrogenase